MKIVYSSYWLTRLCFQRSLAFIYFIAFLVSARQFRALAGEHGLVPVDLFLQRIHFWQSPSLFWLNASDPFTSAIAWLGVGLSVLALSGWSERFGNYFSALVWFLLWFFYLSFVNVGQVFYSFGWETMLLEVGFLAIFFGSRNSDPSAVLVWFLRWVLFRLMFGAGLIKVRGDACWLDWTCMFYHYETQPIPNPLSWHFHYLPQGFQKFQTSYTMFIELIIPWLYFVRPLRTLAGILTIIFQGCLILSGNLSWLNYLTITIALACFDDSFFKKFIRIPIPSPAVLSISRKIVLGILSTLILLLSVAPAVNLFSPRQMMNASFDPLHLVNTYGAFGHITKKRNEIIVEGTEDRLLSSTTEWREYEFKAKPGDVHRLPPVVAPYHLRLDWLMWFAAMDDWRYHPWFLNLISKLLRNDPEILKLIEKNPFGERAPGHIRAVLYHYRFTTIDERKKTGDWWVRTPSRLYLPPVSLEDEQFRRVLRELGWDA